MPDANIPVVNDGHTEFERIMKNAIADVHEFWRKNYPSASRGKPCPELKGHVYFVDGANVTPSVKQGAGLEQDPAG